MQSLFLFLRRLHLAKTMSATPSNSSTSFSFKEKESSTIEIHLFKKPKDVFLYQMYANDKNSVCMITRVEPAILSLESTNKVTRQLTRTRHTTRKCFFSKIGIQTQHANVFFAQIGIRISRGHKCFFFGKIGIRISRGHVQY